jgi:hypothetical protein
MLCDRGFSRATAADFLAITRQSAWVNTCGGKALARECKYMDADAPICALPAPCKGESDDVIQFLPTETLPGGRRMLALRHEAMGLVNTDADAIII